jgi:hypothetical protein
VLDQAELDRVHAVVIDTVAVEQVGVVEGAVTGRAVRAVDAVPAVSAAGAADRLQLGSSVGTSAGYDSPSRAAAVF